MKNILLAVTGLSPQVITETLYALHQDNRRVDAVHVITTRQGKDRVYSDLLGGGVGQYHEYISEYGIDPASIDFGHHNIHVITDEHGIELPDIVSEIDNERLLEKCLKLSFRFTRDPDCALFFSVAGGRKTMSSCLTLAAQIYGRPQDRLFHLLVSPEFESNRDFFYPPKQSKSIQLRDVKGEPFYKETKFAEVNLIPIPFFSIRDRITPDLLEQPCDPGTLMLSLIKEGTQTLTVNLVSCKIIYKTVELDLRPSRMALYAFFAMQKKNCEKDVETCGNCTDCFMDMQAVFESQNELTGIYKRISGTRPLDEMSSTGITSLDSYNFQMTKGKIKKRLLERYGPYALKDLEIASIGSRPNTCYGIRMDRSAIEVVW